MSIDPNGWAAEKIRALYRGNFLVAGICIAIALLFAAARLIVPDPEGVLWLGVSLFSLIALAYGGQGLSFRRTLKKEIKGR